MCNEMRRRVVHAKDGTDSRPRPPNPEDTEMLFFFSLVPATTAVVIGYFVLYAAARSHGRTRLFGRVLAVWLFVIAAAVPLAGAYGTLAGVCPAMDTAETGKL